MALTEKLTFLKLIAITLYSALTFEFVWRFFHKKAFAGRVRYPSMTETVDFLDTKLSMMLFYLGLSSLCMFIRCAPLLERSNLHLRPFTVPSTERLS